MRNMSAWRGLGKLIGDAVEQGTSAIERVHLATAKRPFDALKLVPGIRDGVTSIEAVHDTLVSTAYGNVRAVTRVVTKTVDLALETLDASERAPRE